MTSATGTVTASQLNLRNAPAGAVIARLPRGTVVEIIADQNGWLRVRSGNRAGYVSDAYVARVADDSANDDSAQANEHEALDAPHFAPHFEGNKAIGPDGSWFASRFRQGVYSRGSTTLGAFVQANRHRLDSLTDSQLNVMEAVSENEGKLEAINTWDNAFLSFGTFQWTAGTGSAAGELPALLARLKQRFPDAFDAFFRQYGLDVAQVREPVGQPGRGFFTLQGRLLSSSSAKNELRELIWPWRFKQAGLDDRVRQVQLEHALARAKVFLHAPNVQVRGRDIGAYVTSEYGVAQLLDQHVNRPGHVKKVLTQAVDALAGELDVSRPDQWSDAQEARLIQVYLEKRARTNMTDGVERAARVKRKLDKGVISAARHSYRTA